MVVPTTLNIGDFGWGTITCSLKNPSLLNAVHPDAQLTDPNAPV